MSKQSSIFDRIYIKSPCSENWENMVGNDQVRFCSHCNLHVHNLSSMTRKQAEELVAKTKGRLCVRYIKNPDGHIITNSDRTLFKMKRASRFTSGVFTVALSISGVSAQTPTQSIQPAQSLPENTEQIIVMGNAQVEYPSGYGTLKGKIVDQSGAVVSGANIELTYIETKIVQTRTTDSEGEYQYLSLPGGRYEIDVKSPGFAGAKVVDISIQGNEEKQIDLTLNVADGEVLTGVVGVASQVEELVYHSSERTDRPVRDEKVKEFIMAAFEGNVSKIKQMLKAGMNVNATNEYGDTALMLGAQNKKIVKTLIAAGANVNAKSEFGDTPLMYSMIGDNPAAVKLLILAGADVNDSDDSGRGALMFAAINGQIKIVKILITTGASVNAKDKLNKSALDYAEENNNSEAIELLKAAGAKE